MEFIPLPESSYPTSLPEVVKLKRHNNICPPGWDRVLYKPLFLPYKPDNSKENQFIESSKFYTVSLWNDSNEYHLVNDIHTNGRNIIRCQYIKHKRRVLLKKIYKYVRFKFVKEYDINIPGSSVDVTYLKDESIWINYNSSYHVIFETGTETKCIRIQIPYLSPMYTNPCVVNGTHFFTAANKGNNDLYWDTYVMCYRDSIIHNTQIAHGYTLYSWKGFLLVCHCTDDKTVNSEDILLLFTTENPSEPLEIRRSPPTPAHNDMKLHNEEKLILATAWKQILILDINFNLLSVSYIEILARMDLFNERLIILYPRIITTGRTTLGYLERTGCEYVPEGYTVAEGNCDILGNYENSLILSTDKESTLLIYHTIWSPKNHYLQPEDNKESAKLMYLIKSKHELFSQMPIEILNIILSFAYSF